MKPVALSFSSRRAPKYLLALLSLPIIPLGCSPSAIDTDIARPAPREPSLEKIPGPPLGEFDSFQDALLAACNKIIAKPNAVTPPEKSDMNFDTYWRVSSEYCAWIYYTPDTKYVLSRLTDQSQVDLTNKQKTCILPPTVEDQRYPPNTITYVCALHNHTYDRILSTDDLDFIVKEGMKRGEAPYYGFLPKTKDGYRYLSIVAFFSNHLEEPTCDGFYQYTPLNGQVLKHTRTGEQWKCEQVGHVTWVRARAGPELPQIEKVKGPCPSKDVP